MIAEPDERERPRVYLVDGRNVARPVVDGDQLQYELVAPSQR
jgi:hypothetical protein